MNDGLQYLLHLNQHDCFHVLHSVHLFTQVYLINLTHFVLCVYWFSCVVCLVLFVLWSLMIVFSNHINPAYRYIYTYKKNCVLSVKEALPFLWTCTEWLLGGTLHNPLLFPKYLLSSTCNSTVDHYWAHCSRLCAWMDKTETEEWSQAGACPLL